MGLKNGRKDKKARLTRKNKGFGPLWDINKRGRRIQWEILSNPSLASAETEEMSRPNQGDSGPKQGASWAEADDDFPPLPHFERKYADLVKAGLGSVPKGLFRKRTGEPTADEAKGAMGGAPEPQKKEKTPEKITPKSSTEPLRQAEGTEAPLPIREFPPGSFEAKFQKHLNEKLKGKIGDKFSMKLNEIITDALTNIKEKEDVDNSESETDEEYEDVEALFNMFRKTGFNSLPEGVKRSMRRWYWDKRAREIDPEKVLPLQDLERVLGSRTGKVLVSPKASTQRVQAWQKRHQSDFDFESGFPTLRNSTRPRPNTPLPKSSRTLTDPRAIPQLYPALDEMYTPPDGHGEKEGIVHWVVDTPLSGIQRVWEDAEGIIRAAQVKSGKWVNTVPLSMDDFGYLPLEVAEHQATGSFFPPGSSQGRSRWSTEMFPSPSGKPSVRQVLVPGIETTDNSSKGSSNTNPSLTSSTNTQQSNPSVTESTNMKKENWGIPGLNYKVPEKSKKGKKAQNRSQGENQKGREENTPRQEAVSDVSYEAPLIPPLESTGGGSLELIKAPFSPPTHGVYPLGTPFPYPSPVAPMTRPPAPPGFSVPLLPNLNVPELNELTTAINKLIVSFPYSRTTAQLCPSPQRLDLNPSVVPRVDSGLVLGSPIKQERSSHSDNSPPRPDSRLQQSRTPGYGVKSGPRANLLRIEFTFGEDLRAEYIKTAHFHIGDVPVRTVAYRLMRKEADLHRMAYYYYAHRLLCFPPMLRYLTSQNKVYSESNSQVKVRMGGNNRPLTLKEANDDPGAVHVSFEGEQVVTTILVSLDRVKKETINMTLFVEGLKAAVRATTENFVHRTVDTWFKDSRESNVRFQSGYGREREDRFGASEGRQMRTDRGDQGPA